MGDLLGAITEGDDDRRARTARLAGVTRALLDREIVWAAVNAVAAELVVRRRVTGRHVRSVASGVVARAWAGSAPSAPDG
jgi:hypothetical protein